MPASQQGRSKWLVEVEGSWGVFSFDSDEDEMRQIEQYIHQHGDELYRTALADTLRHDVVADL